jgi:glutamate synthase domain-containing protein 2
MPQTLPTWNKTKSFGWRKRLCKTVSGKQTEHFGNEFWFFEQKCRVSNECRCKLGGFAQNTGEGGISPYHLQHGGDLIWQIGTGYFGCRTENGEFSPELFQQKAALENVKMIEIKLSQGGKPGHGGILPVSKNTEEIAAIRHVKPHTTVNSPPAHTTFNSAEGLMRFIKQLRDLSGGKPVGFKVCIGKKAEFVEICEAMITTGIKPDFIAIDGVKAERGPRLSNFPIRLECL